MKTWTEDNMLLREDYAKDREDYLRVKTRNDRNKDKRRDTINKLAPKEDVVDNGVIYEKGGFTLSSKRYGNKYTGKAFVQIHISYEGALGTFDTFLDGGSNSYKYAAEFIDDLNRFVMRTKYYGTKTMSTPVEEYITLINDFVDVYYKAVEELNRASEDIKKEFGRYNALKRANANRDRNLAIRKGKAQRSWEEENPLEVNKYAIWNSKNGERRVTVLNIDEPNQRAKINTDKGATLRVPLSTLTPDSKSYADLD